MARVQRLLDERIIREITPIFDTRALGYSLDARRREGRRREPAPRREDHQLPPRRLAQLPAQPRLQPVVHDRRPSRTRSSGSRARSTSSQDLTGAESIRQLPTLKLFKIRMDLEMEKGTDALADRRRGRRAASSSTRSSSTTSDIAVDPRHRRATMPVVAEPYAPAAERLGIAAGRGARAPGVAARARRRCAASPRSSTTAAPASRPTAWASGRSPRAGSSRSARRMAPFRGISHCYQRPTYADWPYSRLHDGPRPLEGGVRRGARLDRRGAPASPSARRCTPRTEFKKVRMLYFTDDFRRWEEEHCLTRLLADRHALGRALPPRAPRPARRRQLARARDALDRPRPDLHRARAPAPRSSTSTATLRRLRLLVGPADPRPRAPGGAGGDRRGGRARDDASARHARRGRAGRDRRARMPAVDMLRMTSSGTEASMSAIRARARRDRPRQAPQVRRRLPRPRRRAARRGRLRPRHPGDPRLARACPRPPRPQTRRRPLERPRRASAPRSPSTSSPRCCAEPYPANMGLVPPAAGLPRAAARAGHRARRAARLRRGHHRLPGRPRRRAGAAPACCPT